MTTRCPAWRPQRSMAFALLVGLFAGLAGMPARSLDIANTPLFLPQDVPGNLVLTPSVEWPTMNVAAYKDPTDFKRSGQYSGLFDAQFCYAYVYAATETSRFFDPVERANGDGSCPTRGRWSGKFLNWSTTQAIEPFRIALTGGHRVLDTPTDTWIEKARHDGQGGTTQFPNFSVTTAAIVPAYTPAGWNALNMRIQGLGNRMRFTRSGDLTNSTPVAFDPANAGHRLDNSDATTVYEISVRARVCKPGFVSANCKAYGANFKPEGLIQQYSDRLRYSVFGYLNDSDALRDGAALRARQKFVGPLSYPALQDPVANAAREWDAATGVLFQNPDPADATATGNGVADSGVINYINKFGQMPSTPGGSTMPSHKSFDPVSEMYYAALRYIRRIGNVPEYTNNLTYARASGFPVITNWEDPLLYACQANVVLGIGDVFTHRDKNLPGNTSSDGEPAKPAAVQADTAVDVVALTNSLAALEQISIPTGGSYTGRFNSAFIAGLAYDARVRDQRGDLLGKQTVSTYWVDVREFGNGRFLQPRAINQYWLAAKYGGFRVPDGYNPATQTAPLPDALWWNNGETLESGDKRPDNFFVATNPDAMIESLKQAFAKISAEVRLGSGASVAATSTQLEAGTRLFQTKFYSGSWHGDLVAYPIDANTGTVGAQLWSAADRLDRRTWTERRIFTSNGATRVDFNSTNVTAVRAEVVDYLRGKRTDEAYVVGRMRPRASVLGDIIHSQAVFVPTRSGTSRPSMVYVGANDGMLHAFDADTGEEVFAFVPKAAISSALNDYAEFNVNGYAHRYFVDGDLTVAEVGTRTYLVGTTGRGRPGVFALDVTDPTNMSVVWDRTGGASGTDIPSLGNVLNKPVIAEIAANRWAAIIPNGPNSSTGRAALVVIDLPSGSSHSIDLGGSDNGLSGAVVWRPGAGSMFNVAYAGDLNGNVWKISGITSASATRLTLFNTGRPIQAPPTVAIRPKSVSETWVFVGTGRYLNATDVGSTAIETWYGIIDKNRLIPGRSALVQRTIESEGTSGSVPVRALSEGRTSDLAGKDGWYLDLVSPNSGRQGERMVAPMIFQGLALIGTTRIPDAQNPCGSGGRGWAMAINPFTGARFGTNSYFDANNDGTIDDADGVPGGTRRVPNAGIGLDSGASGVISVGRRIYTSTDIGTIASAGTERLSGQPNRVSWREIVLNMRTSL